MRRPRLRTYLPWLIGLSLSTSVACLALAVYLGFAARTEATQSAAREMATQGEMLARAIETDLGLFDLALHEASNQVPGGTGQQPRAPLLELPLTGRYIGFINILNEVGDVVADPRSNVSRSLNFGGRDYFQDHQKNPSDVLMIGRPFAVAPNQHPSIPISRRLNRPDGSFGGVVVAGVRLSWLSDILARPGPAAYTSVTVRRDDGVVLMRVPFDADSIGRTGAADPAWLAWVHGSAAADAATGKAGGIRMFRRLGSPLVLELALNRADLAAGQRSWLLWLLVLTVLPGFGVLGLGFLCRRLMYRADQVDAAARDTKSHHTRLIATMSHELRSPLTGILGQAELIGEEGGLSARQTTRLAQLTKAGALMRDIVDRVTVGARLGVGSETPTPRPCDLDQLVHTCIGIVEVQAKARGLELIVAIDPYAPKRVMLAADLVQRMLNNLLTNAVKFTAWGTVTLRVTGDSARVRFEVADTGPGIPASKRRRLFGEYDRLDAIAQIPGTGLGLWTTKGLVDAMGGRIGYAENPGGGSVFWIDLPTSVPDAFVPAPNDANPSTRQGETPQAELRCLNILLADDLEMTRGVTAEYLRIAGHVVTEVGDGEAAVAEVAARDFDLLLTDMRMPVVDGLEATRRIRALPGHRGRIPVVLLTADLIAVDRGESGQTGVDLCLKKPFLRSELLAAVAAAARLTPVPDNRAPNDRVFDDAVFGELSQSLDAASCVSYLDAAVGRIEDLLTLLARPDVAENLTLRDAVHDLIGVTGLLGLGALSSCLRLFDIAPDGTTAATALRDAATIAVQVLRGQREPFLSGHGAVSED